MRIAIGMIVRDILSAHPLTDFLDNAEKHGHALDRVIIVYSHQADPGAVEELRSRTNLSLIKLQSNERAHLIMKEIGVRHSSIHQLLYCPLIDAHGLIPYGFNRNQALMEAMFTGTDYLIFVDSDVRPEVLRKTPDGAVQSEEIDFIGAHLHGLSLGADVTSSDYSGYNILPPASFDGMKDLLWGLHKESMADFWQNSEAHRGLVIQEDQNAEPQPTTKVLGGNLGIRMSALTTLPPFFSPYYFYNRTPLLARGEDTLMGMAASQSHIRCLDIQTPIFHDTYGDYPKVPDLRNDSRVRDRLYYACTGWIGRNVFFRWKTGHISKKAIRNTGQLPKYLIQNHHDAIIDRAQFDAVQMELARRRAQQGSTRKSAPSGLGRYSGKYALSGLLFCGECGTAYRRVVWTQHGEKRTVWRCCSRLDYGKKYCEHSPTLDEAPLQQAILNAVNASMSDHGMLSARLMSAMEQELAPIPGESMSLGDIDRAMEELGKQFDKLLGEAANADDAETYVERFQSLSEGMEDLKRRKAGILQIRQEQDAVSRRLQASAAALDAVSAQITEWDEKTVYQLLEKVTVMEGFKIRVTFRNGQEIEQSIDQPKRRKRI